MKNIYVKILKGSQDNINSIVLASPQKSIESGIRCYLHEVETAYRSIYGAIKIKYL